MEDTKDKENRAKEKYIETLKMEGFLPEENKKKCFIITPIGDEGSSIRRHIDGIINAAIKPALERIYEVRAAHHIDIPGNITKQIIKEIYESDLVIANLTDRNPNVMYELALRHCLGSPTIMIAEQDTDLPSDIISERTIFYKNDAQGVLDLKEQIKKAEGEISQAKNEDKTGPIYEVLANIIQNNEIIKSIAAKDSADADTLTLLLQRIDDLDRKVTISQERRPSNPVNLRKKEYEIKIKVKANSEQCIKICEHFISEPNYPKWLKNKIEFWADDDTNTGTICITQFTEKYISHIEEILTRACEECGINPERVIIREMTPN